jgi:hypothetical protein
MRCSSRDWLHAARTMLAPKWRTGARLFEPRLLPYNAA